MIKSTFGNEKNSNNSIFYPLTKAIAIMAFLFMGNDIFSQNTFPSSGNTGIGTTTPSEELEVQGDVKVTNLSGTGDRYVVSDPSGKLKEGPPVMVIPGGGNGGGNGGGGNNNNPNAGWLINGNNNITSSHFAGTLNSADFAIRTFNIERLLISGTTGNIGIGTSMPSHKLTVAGNILATGIVQAGGLNVNGQISFDSLNVTGKLKVGNTIYLNGNVTNPITGGPATYDEITSSKKKLVFGGADANGVTDMNNISVGIGTISPEKNLHVKATTCSGCPVVEDETVFIRLEDQIVDQSNNPIANHKWDIGASGSFFIRKIGNTSMFAITPDNRVAIGPVTPTATLHIGRISSQTGDMFKITHTGSPKFVVANNGNVGIGIANPQVSLHISGSGNQSLDIQSNDPLGSHTRLMAVVSNGVQESQLQYKGRFLFVEPLSGQVKMSILANGNVGIGTSSPGYRLDVCGTIRSTEWIVETGWCDFVFEENYDRMNWKEKSIFLKQNKHLPGIASGKEIETNGLKAAETMRGMVLNIEENTLDIIDLYRVIEMQAEEIEQMKKELKNLKK